MDMKCLIRKLGELMCSAMIASHAFFGCDSTSAFIRQGKSQPERLVKHPVFVGVVGTLGETDGVPGGRQTELEKLVCCIYGKPSYKDACLIMPLTLTTRSVASQLDIIYDEGDDNFEDNSTAVAN